MTNRHPLKTALACVAAVLLLGACQKEAKAPADDPTVLTSQEIQTAASANDFAFRAFSRMNANEPTVNLCLSPFSISTALTMTYNGADGSTKAAMRQTLGFQPLTDEEIGKAYKSLVDRLRGADPKVTMTTANAIWHAPQYQLQVPFVQTNTTYFGAAPQALDFKQPTAKGVINGWVENNTNGKIQNLVEELDPNLALMLVNAVYFKGTWTHAFDKTLTVQMPFQLAGGGSSQASYMRLRNVPYQTYADAKRRIIDLPYGNKQYSMTVIVPQGQQTVADVVSQLNSTSLTDWLAAAQSTTYELYLPKFKIEYKKDLIPMLSQLGMGEAFGSGANFSRMVVGNSRLAIGSVTHQTFIEVNEEGTEAAAATSVGVVNTSVPPSVMVNRPFVFVVREKTTNAILFIGQVMQP